MSNAKVIQLGKNRDWWKSTREPANGQPVIIQGKPKPLPSRFYSVQQVAERLGVSCDLVYDAIRRGEIQSQRVGRLRRIAEEELVEYLRLQMRKAR